jgi:hypothetical protein
VPGGPPENPERRISKKGIARFGFFTILVVALSPEVAGRHQMPQRHRGFFPKRQRSLQRRRHEAGIFTLEELWR